MKSTTAALSPNPVAAFLDKAPADITKKVTPYIKKPGESKYPWDYYKILQTIPGDEAYRPLDKGGCPLVAAK